MDLINSISLFLILTPIYAVITDIKSWKIKNYFIFPFLLISIILSFFIEWFYYNSTNIIGFLIIIFFGYLFYKDSKWWAGDWKYIILIWLNSLVITFLLWINTNIINLLFINIFGLLLMYNIYFLLINFNKIKKIKLKKDSSFNLLNSFYLISFIYLIAYFIWFYIWLEYMYISIFLIIILLMPYFNKINFKYLKFLIIFLWLSVCIYNLDFLNLWLITLVFFLFLLLQWYSEQIFDVIDVREINIYDLKQWDILTLSAINRIKNEAKIELNESPLQWIEVYDIIWKYKELWKKADIIIYKELRIGIIMYIWFFITIVYSILK